MLHPVDWQRRNGRRPAPRPLPIGEARRNPRRGRTRAHPTRRRGDGWVRPRRPGPNAGPQEADPMMHRSLASLVALALAGLALLVTASAQGRRVTFGVPHAFTVGTETLPAGEYTIRRASAADPRVFAVQCAETGRAAVVIATPERSAGAP